MESKLINVSLSDPHTTDNCKSKMLNYTIGSSIGLSFCSVCLDDDNILTNAFNEFIRVLENHQDEVAKCHQEYRDTLIPISSGVLK